MCMPMGVCYSVLGGQISLYTHGSSSDHSREIMETMLPMSLYTSDLVRGPWALVGMVLLRGVKGIIRSISWGIIVTI